MQRVFGAILLPSSLGTRLDDTRGRFSIDATTTRLNVDARAPVGPGLLRGYIEYDLNGVNDGSLGFELRHAYGSWQSRAGIVTVGQTWSTLMDLKILPEGLTEPTVSGAIFQGQAQQRWTQPLGENLKADFPVEGPSGTDVLNQPTFQPRVTVPDFVSAIEYGRRGVGHVRLGGIVRRIQLTTPESVLGATATGWGLSMGAHLEGFGKDRLASTATYGEGPGLLPARARNDRGRGTRS